MLHRDGYNQLNCVVHGSKLWTVIDVSAAPRGTAPRETAPKGGRSMRAAPRGLLHGGVADLFNTDVRSILILVLLTLFKGPLHSRYTVCVGR